MCGSSPDTPDPWETAEANEWAAQQQWQREQAEIRRTEAATRAQDQLDRTHWTNATNESQARTIAQIRQQFSQAGLNPNDYMPQITSAVNLERGGMSYGGNSSFSSDLGENIMSDIRGRTVNDYTRALDEFAGDNFERTAFADTADDAVINAILGEQFGSASDAIMRAYERGTLNDQGYRYAMDNLNTQKAAGLAQLQSIGGGIIGGYRTGLSDYADNARDRAEAWDFGDNFNLDSYRTGLQDMQTNYSNNLEGDIRTAVGGTQFFDTSDLIGKAGTAQGATNTAAKSSGLLAAIGDRNKNEEQKRGLGTEGSF